MGWNSRGAALHRGGIWKFGVGSIVASGCASTAGSGVASQGFGLDVAARSASSKASNDGIASSAASQSVLRL